MGMTRRQWTVWLAAWLPLSLWFARPLWVTRTPPLCDLPNHLARITALHHLNDQWWQLSDWYERSLGLVPYLAHYYVVHLMSYVTRDVTTANQIYMVAYVMTAPLCGLAFARATGRSPWLAFLTLPVATGIFLQWGFISFCAGVMVMLPCCALLFRLLDQPSRRRAIGLGAATAGLYFCHVLPWGTFGVYAALILIIELAARRPWKTVLTAAGAVSFSLLLFVFGMLRARSSGYLQPNQPYKAISDTPDMILKRALEQFNFWGDRSVDEWVQIGLLVAVMVLVLSERSASDEPWHKRVRVPLAFMLSLALLFALPFWLLAPFNWWMINTRFIMLVALFGCFLPRGELKAVRAGVLAASIALACLMPRYAALVYKEFAGRVEPIMRLIQATPLGSNTLLVHTPRQPGQVSPFDDPHLQPRMDLWRELYNYPLVLRGGFDPYLYDDGFPVKRKKALAAPVYETAALQSKSVDESVFVARRMLHGWDFIIVAEDNRDVIPVDGVALVMEQGPWGLYRNLNKDRPPEIDPPGTPVREP